MVQGIDEWEGRGAIERSPVVEGGRDAHRGLVDIWNAEIYFTHRRWSIQVK